MSAIEVTVVDYGVGNLFSVQRSLEHCGAHVTVTSDKACILASPRVVLPGVGAFANGISALRKLDLVDVIGEVAARGTPLLGICLGMQLLLDESEEFGVNQGLGLIPGRVVPIPAVGIDGGMLKRPHIGWSELLPAAGGRDWTGTVLSGNRSGDAFYFVHSFMAVPAQAEYRIADCDYGGHRLPAVIARGNVTGCQFHPEKSGEAGLRLIRSFCETMP